MYAFFGNTGLEVGLNEDGITNYCTWNSTDGSIRDLPPPAGEGGQLGGPQVASPQLLQGHRVPHAAAAGPDGRGRDSPLRAVRRSVYHHREEIA